MADRLGAISPSGFVANTPIVVEPRAIQALTEAFRSGQIRAEEIADRAMVRPAQQAAATLAADPQLVEAKKRSMLADASTAEVELEAKQLALKNAQQQANIPPIIQQQNAELSTKGLQVFPDTGGIWTPEKSQEVTQLWKDLKTWEAEFSSAAAQKQSLKEVDITQTDGAVEKISYEEGSQRKADPVRAAGLIDWIRSNATPRQWIQSGKQPSPSLFGPAPGAIAAPATSPVAATAVAPPGTAPTASTAPTAPAVAAPSITAAVAPVTATTGGLIIKPAGAKGEPPTLGEQQAKLITQLPQAYSSLNQIASTYNKYINESVWPDWAQPLLGILDEKNPYNVNAKTLTAAVNAAVPGFARGIFGEVGVLTDKDVDRYRALLPTARTPNERSGLLLKLLGEKLHDTTLAFVSVYEGNPAVDNLRQSLQISDEEIVQYKTDLAASANKFKTFGGTSDPGLEQFGARNKAKVPAKPFTTSSGRFTGHTVTDPNTGKQYFVPAKTGAAASSPLYVQPKELSSGSKSKPTAPGAGMVEPKPRAGGRF